MAPVRIEAQRSSWETPMANKVTDVAVVLRESMEALGWAYEREKSERIYSRFSVIVPMPKVAYVFRFRVLEPLDGVTIDTWEMRFTHKGDITFLAVKDYTYSDLEHIHELLREMVDRLPRRPWDFPLWQRVEAGIMIPEWGQSRRMWQQMLFDVGERTPKGWVPRGSLGERLREELGLEPEVDGFDGGDGDGGGHGDGDRDGDRDGDPPGPS